MLGKRLKIWCPGGVDRPIEFEAAADPIEELLLTFLFGRFDRIMDTSESDTSLYETFDDLQPSIPEERVAASAAVLLSFAFSGVFLRLAETKEYFWRRERFLPSLAGLGFVRAIDATHLF